MTPDIYTVIGLLGTVITMVGYILSRSHPGFFWLATFGFVVNWYGDSMDGTLARYRHIERPVYGYFIDHTMDAVGQVLFFVGLGLSPYVNFDVACLALVAYLLMDVLVFLRTNAVHEFRISFSMLGPTEARILAILLNTAMFFFGRQVWNVNIGTFCNFAVNPYDIFVGAVGALLLYFFLTTTYQDAVRLIKEGK